MRVLFDSSAVFSFLDSRDPVHDAVAHAVSRLFKANHELFLTNFLVGESHALIGSRLAWDAARNWLEAHGRPIIRVLPEDEARAVAIINAHTDKSYSYVDATSFAVMERLGARTALTLDTHFRQYGFETLPA